MNELTSEWINKAENDFLTASVVINQIAEPLPDIACFHCQQCAEKYLKGFLTEHKIEFPYKHMLVPLLELCIQKDKSFIQLLADLRTLEGYAVATRYPGIEVTLKNAKDALEAVMRVRLFIRSKLFP